MCYMPHQSDYSLYCLPNNIWWEVQSKELGILQYSVLPCYLVNFRSKYLLNTLFSNILSPAFSFSMTDQVSPLHKNNRQIYIYLYFTRYFNMYIFW